MEKKEITINDFRELLNKIVEDDHFHFSHEMAGEYKDVLVKVAEMSDEQLLATKLYSGIGMDSIDVWEMVCLIEADKDIVFHDEIDDDFGTGVGLTVEKFLQILNNRQWVDPYEGGSDSEH